MNILILSSKEKSFATKSIVIAAKKQGHNVRVLDPLKLASYISDIETGYDRIYDNIKKEFNRIYLNKYDVIIPRLTSLYYSAHILELLSNNAKLYSVQSADGLRIASDKLRTSMLLSAAGLPVPKTILSNDTTANKTIIDKLGGLPIIIKTIHGSQGNGVSIVKDAMSAKSVLQTLRANSVKYIIQEYIDYTQDIRAIVVGERVVAAMERTRMKKDFRANISLGAEGKPIVLSKADEYLCVQAAKAINLNVCGVDLLKTKHKTYVNEVNGNFGFKIQKITHTNIASKIVKYAVTQAENKTKHTENRTTYLKYNDIQSELQELRKLTNAYDYTFFKQMAKKHRGRNCTYTNREQITKTLTINNANDIIKIVSDTFNIN